MFFEKIQNNDEIASIGAYHLICGDFYSNAHEFGKTIQYLTRSAICFTYANDDKGLVEVVKCFRKLKLHFFNLYQHGSISLVDYLRATDIEIPKPRGADEFFRLAEVLIDEYPCLALKYYAKSFELYANRFRRLSSLLKDIATVMSVFVDLIENDIIKSNRQEVRINGSNHDEIQLLDKPKQWGESKAITCPKCGANEFEEKRMVYKCCYCNSSWPKKA